MTFLAIGLILFDVVILILLITKWKIRITFNREAEYPIRITIKPR